jgi:hypothetical protein
MRYILLVTAIGIGIIGWSGAITAVFDESISGTEQFVAFVGFGVIVGTLIALWLARLSITVKISTDQLTLQLPPLPRTRIELSTLTSAEKAEVNAFGDYGGLGIKGSRKDRLFGLSGSSGVRIKYEHPDGESRVATVLTKNPDDFINALGMR